MSDNWDFYFCHVDERPASIFLDLGIADKAPIKSHPIMAYVRIFMPNPRSDGLSSDEDFEEIKEIEDLLSQELESNLCLYVGRNTSNGCRDFYFYLATSDTWVEDVARAMSNFPKHEFESGTRDDAEWNTYFGFLHPSEEDLERIQNRHTCEALERNGDCLTAERQIDHWVYFKSAGNRTAFIEKSASLGYAVAQTWNPGNDDHRFGVRLSSLGVPSFVDIDNLTLPLFRIARDFGGDYDGWETQVIR